MKHKEKAAAEAAAKERVAVPEKKAKAAGAKEVPTFSIPADDPFVDGAARAYGGDMIDPTARPLVLRADDPAALAALEAYRLRASGGCNHARAKAANEAINAFAR